ncbi:hypothetical protein L228DRAFT_15487 [Xylona heveae TC161]|uniref:Uncharacterized protein n=1 Tax=Xylona heveae (strain CBS 132557 / TC161) TaxID=1328760 RepID=A0A165JT83_XYLHT|nr:hypothetical protein L228DRAFT_15487 [Xylona heveae TC161]KZF26594.1 hypothetical protein L228DRAFT_15487 [Xylona heveae TC161]
MASGQSRNPPSWTFNFHASSSRGVGDDSRSMPRLPSLRFPGDGLDFRTPASTSQPAEAVIDLTNEPDSPPTASARNPTSSRASRPPRFPSDIIDLEVPNADEQRTARHREESPDVEFVSSRRIPSQEQLPGLTMLGLGPAHLFLGHGFGGRPPRGINTSVPAVAGPRGQFLHEPPSLILGSMNRRPFPRYQLNREEENVNLTTDNFTNPGAVIDYEEVGFRINNSPPPYKAPNPARPGFTRSPGEDDVVVCPYCELELGTGKTDLKRQVWVIKNCGHVYCGECTSKRPLRKSAKSKNKPFAACVVEGCGTPTYPKGNMFQAYLG